MARHTLAFALVALVACTSPNRNKPTDGAADAAAATADLAFVPAPHAPLVKVPTGSGPRLNPLSLVVIVGDGDPLANDLFAFAKGMPKSAWWTAVTADYGDVPVSVSAIVGPAITSNVSGGDVIAYVDNLVANGAPQPNGHTFYLVYLPEGVSILEKGMPVTGCWGYHSVYHKGANDNVGAIVRCTANTIVGTLIGETALGSHETLESLSDPAPFTGEALPDDGSMPMPARSVWALAYGHEVGDLCETVNGIDEGQVRYQRIWSAKAAAAGDDPCEPAHAGPYYSVTTDAAWYPVAGGEAVVIPVGGWSSAPAYPWSVQARVKNSSASGFVAAPRLRVGHRLVGAELAERADAGHADRRAGDVGRSDPRHERGGLGRRRLPNRRRIDRGERFRYRWRGRWRGRRWRNRSRGFRAAGLRAERHGARRRGAPDRRGSPQRLNRTNGEDVLALIDHAVRRQARARLAASTPGKVSAHSPGSVCNTRAMPLASVVPSRISSLGGALRSARCRHAVLSQSLASPPATHGSSQ